jgi:hypothetical protein
MLGIHRPKQQRQQQQQQQQQSSAAVFIATSVQGQCSQHVT